MGDRDERAVEAAHQLLEPLARLDVEVRLRLVEQQHVRLAGEAGGERDELPLAAREDARRLDDVLVLEAELEQQRAGAALEARAARGRPALDAALLAVEHARHPVEVAAECAQQRGDLGQLLLQLGQIGPRGVHGRQRVAPVALDLLRQIRDDQAAPLRQLAGVELLQPGQHEQERRLAAAVRADHAHAGAGLDVEVEPLEDRARAEALDRAAE